ncbi:TMEM43 family protein [Lysobacter humi (ex Lee et al. 2017)]
MRALAAPWIAALLAAAPLHAQQPPEGEPKASGVLTDTDFGVESSAFGLERRVEMYQWRRDARGYSRVWNAAPIDSAAFDAAHRNPARLPIRNRQWWVESISLDGKPLPLGVARLVGQWTPMRPGFSRLPGRIAKRYQPEGDGLGSSYNPLRPKIGDVRITWHEFVLPPLAGKVELRGGAWALSARAAAAPAPVRPAIDIAAATRRPVELLRPWFIAVAVGSLVGLWFLVRAITGGKA